ncbi:MAG: heavy metal translocating P-type ATPase [Clostridiales bacterium]|nr:heavy metal translocating P-type ATPase [Clostridiales bacterium]
MKKRFTVGGMSCSACASGIEKSVGKLDGVNSVSVSLLDKSVTVDYNQEKVTEKDIEIAVVKLGYTFGNGKSERAISDADILKNRFFISLCILIPLMYLCLGGAIGLPVFYDNRINFSIQLVLAIVILIINRRFFINGVKAVKNLSPNMDTLVALGSCSAFIYSVVMTVLLFAGAQNPTHVFFDSSAMVVSLVTLGKWLEEISKQKTGSAIEKLSKLIPQTVTIMVDGKEKSVYTSEIREGDIIAVKSGEYIAVDGVVVEGGASVDKSAITGESMPEEISVGGVITSGSIVLSGYLLVKAEKVGEHTLFNKILETVKSAGASKAPIQRFADKVAGVFVPIVTVLALICFAVWIAVTGDLYKSFNFGISVLVISCPCALGLATPVAVMTATGRSAKHGILFKDAESLQNLCKTNCVLLDKTATLTVGKPKVTDYVNLSDKNLSGVISALEQKSSHPLAKCICEYLGESEIKVEEYSYLLGRGIIGKIGGEKYRIGNLELVSEVVKIDDKYLPKNFKGKTVIYVTENDRLVSIFALADYLKDGAKEVIRELKSKGIKAVMITGDNEETASVIAEELGIEEYRASVLPTEKYEVVEKYKAEGYFVAMVGDGINDSPALKSAHVGVAMGNGSDIAIDSADVVLTGGNIKALVDGISTSKKSLRIKKENLFWAFIYNLLGIPIAGGALSMLGVTLTPIIASACMCVSSLFVVLNALRVGVEKENKDKVKKQKFTLKIENMMCNHCVKKITEIAEKTSGISKIKVSLESKTLTFYASENFALDGIIDEIKKARFIVERIA